jgi:hypothetical protein
MTAPLRVKKVRPGDDALAYCGRCKAERTHQVVALNANGTPATVICRTCGGQRRFREKKEANAAPARAPRKAARRDETADAPAGPARPYSPQETYANGEWIEHSKFGAGKVTQARPGKIEVRFDSGVRVLLHAG